MASRTQDRRRIGLVGCVSEKAPQSTQARNLYASTLFSGRRRFVEASCDEWWILSAEHGLVHPDDVLAPYNVALKGLGRVQLRNWSARVLASIDERIRPRVGDIFEIHAGKEYRDFGVADGLRSRGCDVALPAEGMRIGAQLRFYNTATRP